MRKLILFFLLAFYYTICSFSQSGNNPYITHPEETGAETGIFKNSTYTTTNYINYDSEWVVSGGVATFQDNGVAGMMEHELNENLIPSDIYTFTYDCTSVGGVGCRFALGVYVDGSWAQVKSWTTYSDGLGKTLDFTTPSGTNITHFRIKGSSTAPAQYDIDNLDLVLK